MKTTPETAKEALLAVREVLAGLDDWSFDAIHTACFDLIAKMQVKNGWLLWPLRVALSGMQFTPGGGIEIAAIIGKEETCKRVDAALARLG